MTKKDFIKIGELLQRVDFTPELLDGLCQIFKEANPNFKEDRFRAFAHKECGPNGGKII